MTSRLLQIVGFCVVFGLGGAMVVASLVSRRWFATVGEAIRAMTSRRLLLRLLIVCIWAWLGWHFLARTT